MTNVTQASLIIADINFKAFANEVWDCQDNDLIHLSCLSKKIHSAPEYNYVRLLIIVSLIKFGLNYSTIDFSLLKERERLWTVVDTI